MQACGLFAQMYTVDDGTYSFSVEKLRATVTPAYERGAERRRKLKWKHWADRQRCDYRRAPFFFKTPDASARRSQNPVKAKSASASTGRCIFAANLPI